MTQEDICKIYEALLIAYPKEARVILLRLLNRIRAVN